MFGGSRRLPLLQRLDVGYEDDEEAGSFYHHRGWQRATAAEERGLLLRRGQLQELVACFPGLAELSLVVPMKHSMGCSEMKQLLQLTALTKLGVGGEWWDDSKVKQVLLQLTGKRRNGACNHCRLHFALLVTCSACVYAVTGRHLVCDAAFVPLSASEPFRPGLLQATYCHNATA
jgi:hypothetical protein